MSPPVACALSCVVWASEIRLQERVGRRLPDRKVAGADRECAVELPTIGPKRQRAAVLVLDEHDRHLRIARPGGQRVDARDDRRRFEGWRLGIEQGALNVDDEKGLFHGSDPDASEGHARA